MMAKTIKNADSNASFSNYILKPLSLNPNNSVATVTLENEALLSAFFIVFATIMAQVFTIY